MINRYIDLIIHDEEYGDCAVRAEEVEYDGIHVSLYEFENTPKVKEAGGRYCLHCIETDRKKFYRNEFMAMHALNKFIDDNKELYRRCSSGNCS